MIIFFAYSRPSSASVRYRVKYVAEELERRYNLRARIIYPRLRSFPRLAAMLFRALVWPGKDLFVFQKISEPGPYTNVLRWFLKRNPGRSLYDIDDAMYLLKGRDVIDEFAGRVRAVIVGSRFLEDRFKGVGVRTVLITTAVPDHRIVKAGKNPKLNVGWIGYFSIHRDNLREILFPALKQLGFPFRLTLLGIQDRRQREDVEAFFEGCPHIELRAPLKVRWSDELSVHRAVAEFDVGVTPLLGNDLNRAKSAFKIKQYLSCGVPVLASPVGENPAFVVQGRNGFLCATPEEFRDRLSYFAGLAKEEYRVFIGNARRSYEEDFSLSRIIPAYHRLLGPFLAGKE